MNWKILSEKKDNPKLTTEEIVDTLLTNRGLVSESEKSEFTNPTHPKDISLGALDINKKQILKLIERIKAAKEKGERVIIYGDYDADGVTATAILWECLYLLKIEALPYLPNRFSEGYGINFKSVKNLNKNDKKISLIITVDNGIVANKEIEKIQNLGIDVIVTDHHQIGEYPPEAYSVVHTTKVSGSALAWIVAREIYRAFSKEEKVNNGLELAAIGTVSDMMPLVGVNRSFAKFGIKELRKSTRPGLDALYNDSGFQKDKLNAYHIGFMIAPRLNAMGRMKHAMDSLRLLCTKSENKARELSYLLSKTNKERQSVVEEVVLHARENVVLTDNGPIIIANEDYHEGIIGLAASRLVEEFYRPSIVITKGKDISKASARSISGFNIIEAIRQLNGIIEQGGGHTMAAGFTIKTSNLDKFIEEFTLVCNKMITSEILSRELKIDINLDFSQLNWELETALKIFEPVGLGNPSPTFSSTKVRILESRSVGQEKKHLKLVLWQNSFPMEAIAFNFGEMSATLKKDAVVDIAYSLEENLFNGARSLQLKIKDIKISG